MSSERFYLTRNENGRRLDPKWRLCMVTDALTDEPRVTIYNNSQFEHAFELEPYVLVGQRIVEPKDQ